MLKHSLLLGIISSTLLCSPCFAQDIPYDTSTIQTNGSTSALSAAEVAAAAAIAAEQAALNASRPQMYNGLPPTSLDSFVSNAGGSAELIYGDEGTDGLPPYYGFDASHRINAGITGQSAAGLTTGHSSYLPDAWGGDEFTGNEWSMSGSGATNNPTALAIEALLQMMGLAGL
ncbi:MAG: hypothetical protein P4L53_06130 [Candidatus Obscuribacterales bacterium]|nr:hypothetical protein [Candidatus Obscuribacterales bacterium]